jgi:hypothetical protein
VKHEPRGVLKSIRLKVWTLPPLSQILTDTAMETADTVPENTDEAKVYYRISMKDEVD